MNSRRSFLDHADYLIHVPELMSAVGMLPDLVQLYSTTSEPTSIYKK